MKAYIQGTGIISPQHTIGMRDFPSEIVSSENNLLSCIEPAYGDYLNPVMARRMGRIIKMGIAAAMISLKDAGITTPDAIITGTALGCLGETEKFLKAIIADDEQYLTPTSFIQSLQNSVSAQIALQLSCTGHNFTFVHKGFSFESALLDALLLIHEKEANNVLVGGLDEMTQHNYLFYKKLEHWKQEKINSLNLYDHHDQGTIGGEGASFFVLTDQPRQETYAEFTGVKTIYNPASTGEMVKVISEWLSEIQISTEDIDLVIYGYNGNILSDHWYNDVRKGFFHHAASTRFKHLCGEYQTASAFAMWLACLILKNGIVPEIIKADTKKSERLSHVLIYNIYENNHSLLLLKKV